MGVWIETLVAMIKLLALTSHPSWVCGLKQKSQENVNKSIEVTPFVGVWIETRKETLKPSV